jgi:hypothetical protein
MENKVNVRKHYDVATGKFVSFFRDKNNEVCRYIIINKPIARQLGAYYSIYNDLINSFDAFHCLIENSEHYNEIIKRSLMVNAVITYMRCFTKSEGRKTNLDSKSVLKNNEKLKQYHSKIEVFRHQYLAHSGKSNHEEISVVGILNPDLKNKKVLGIDIETNFTSNIDSYLNDYLELVEHVITAVKKKIEELNLIVLKEILNEDLEKLYNLSSLPDERYFIFMETYRDRDNLNIGDAIMEIEDFD